MYYVKYYFVEVVDLNKDHGDDIDSRCNKDCGDDDFDDDDSDFDQDDADDDDDDDDDDVDDDNEEEEGDDMDYNNSNVGKNNVSSSFQELGKRKVSSKEHESSHKRRRALNSVKRLCSMDMASNETASTVKKKKGEIENWLYLMMYDGLLKFGCSSNSGNLSILQKKERFKHQYLRIFPLLHIHLVRISIQQNTLSVRQWEAELRERIDALNPATIVHLSRYDTDTLNIIETTIQNAISNNTERHSMFYCHVSMYL